MQSSLDVLPVKLRCIFVLHPSRMSSISPNYDFVLCLQSIIHNFFFLVTEICTLFFCVCIIPPYKYCRTQGGVLFFKSTVSESISRRVPVELLFLKEHNKFLEKYEFDDYYLIEEYLFYHYIVCSCMFLPRYSAMLLSNDISLIIFKIFFKKCYRKVYA